MVNTDLLFLVEKFVAAWNAHDIDALMECMSSDDCVFYASAGSGARGDAFIGFDEVKKSYEAVFQKFPDGKWKNAKHFISGNRGLSEWLFTGTTADGAKSIVPGIDVYEFANGKIKVKDSYRKQLVG